MSTLEPDPVRRPVPSGAQDAPAARARRARTHALLVVPAAVLLLAATACGAPYSQALEGPTAREVETSLRSGTETFSHRAWDRLLAEGTRDGLVDYRHFQRHRDELDAYLERVAGADLEALAPDHLKALLINAYNAYTIRAILEHPTVGSIREIDGVWTETRHEVGGHGLTLDQIEHNLLRPFFRDPRIHFAVNCASISCAPLPPWAFTGEELERQLEDRTTAFLRDTANVRVRGGVLRLSRYFDWYGTDFTAEGWKPRAESIPAFVARYARDEVVRFVEEHEGRPEVSFLEYDWSLNAVEGGAPRADGERAAEGGWVADLRGWVAGFGPAGPVVYGLAYVVATVLFVPGSALTIGAGVAFGLLWGTVLVSLASVTGAALAFLVARYLLRDRVASWVEGRQRFRAVDRAVGEEGWRIVALTRLSPLFPFNLLNYFYGLTRVSFRGYVLASWIAMLPGTLLYVYLGAAGAQVASAAAGAADWGRTAIQVLGLLATLGVAIVAGRIATRALRAKAGNQAVDEDAEKGDASAAAEAGSTARAAPGPRSPEPSGDPEGDRGAVA